MNKKPIIICPPKDKEDYGDIDKLSLRQRLSIALLEDNKAAFMSFIKDPGFEGIRKDFTADTIFTEDALEIAKAVLNGETKHLIDTKDELKHGMTPLHLATIHCAPRLTKYLLQNGGVVDAVCDNIKLDLQYDTPIALCTNGINTIPRNTLFDLVWRLCFHNRARLEIIRMFVESDKQHTWASEAFLEYGQNGEMPKLAALFLAAPELFSKSPERGELSLLSKLRNKLNFLELKTDIKNQLSTLLDVFAFVGHKLATYIRLEEFAPKSITKEEVEQSMLEVESFLREAAIAKHGDGDEYVDYYLRFFEIEWEISDDDKVGKRNSDDHDDSHYDQMWEKFTSKFVGNDIYYALPSILEVTSFKRSEIHKLIPTLEGQNPVRARNLSKAIEAYNREMETEIATGDTWPDSEQ